MRFFTVNPREGSEAKLEIFLRENQEGTCGAKRPCVLICPGGAYVFCGDRDSEPNALAFLGEDFQACVLRYNIRATENDPILHDEPMRDCAASIRYIRSHAEEFGIDPNKIVVLGVSAGGHVAASSAVFWNDEERIPGGSDGLGKPNAMVLCYPVITGGEFAHRQSIGNLTGIMEPDPANEAYSLERFVNENTCPAFIWQPVGDSTVPVDNAILMAKALRAHNVPFDLHLYSQGWHGIGLAHAEVGSHYPHVSSWFPLAVRWLKDHGFGTL